MFRGLQITPPFFEVGPKAYTFGPDMLRVAMRADQLGRAYGVGIIIDPQYVDISIIAEHVEWAMVFAPHMDSLEPGRGQGSVLPEAVKAAGAVGVMLNHVEHRLSRAELARTVRRADEVGLATMVCTDDVEEAVAVAGLEPNIIVVESPELIGTGKGTESSSVAIAEIDQAIWRVNPDIRVLHGAGIGSARDVFEVIAAGAQATGSSSGIFKAPDPQAMLEAMIRAAREAWDTRH